MMENLISDSLECARKHFEAYELTEEEMASLLAVGERDLRQELVKLSAILNAKPIDMEHLNLSSHAVKGLLLNMGNKEAALKFTELREEDGYENAITQIKRLLKLDG